MQDKDRVHHWTGNLKLTHTLDKSRLGDMIWGVAQPEWFEERMTGGKMRNQCRQFS